MLDLRVYQERVLREDGDGRVDANDAAAKLFLRADEIAAMTDQENIPVMQMVSHLGKALRSIAHIAGYLGYPLDELATLNAEEQE